MKVLGYLFACWPDMNKEIEAAKNTCNACQVDYTMPDEVGVHSLKNTTLPWVKIHIDLAAPLFGKRFLIVYGSLSKWIEIIPIGNKKLSAAATRSRGIFVSDIKRYGKSNTSALISCINLSLSVVVLNWYRNYF